MTETVTGDTPPLTGKEREIKMTKCGHCSFPATNWQGPGTPHPNCPRAVRNGPNARYKLITCECREPGCGDQVLRCTYCKTEEQDAIDPNDWSCIDKESCRNRINTSLMNNPAYQAITEIRRTSMAKVANENAEKAAKREKAAPKVGKCLHCDGVTKGGKFLPGHDAAYVSALVAATLAKPASADANRKKALAGSETLAAKFDKSLRLANEREEKKATAAQEKADAKAAKAKAPASA